MINPYSCYIISFITALIAYQFGWSNLYPSLEWPLILFLVITLLIHLFLSFYWAKNNSLKINPVTVSTKPLYVTVFIYCLWAIEFIYEGGVPLLKILLGKPYDYRLFGVPSLHVFIVTFSSFYTIYLFHLFIVQRKQSDFILYLINSFAALLIFNRGMFLFNLSGSLIVFLFTIRKFSYGKSLLAIVTLPIIFYLFGVLGNVRVSFEAKREYDDTLFLDIGRANENFRESVIPNEFFWSYVYITSPLANLQTNIHSEIKSEVSSKQWFGFLSNEFIFDFISKRTNRLFGIQAIEESRIEGPFNVSTVYSRSYSYFGWIGIAIMALFVLILPLLYKRVLGNNDYAPTGIAILCTMYLFLVFDNTIRFTGLGFQLAYPILFPIAEQAFKRINNG